MARWEIKNVGMKGVAMAVPENVVKTSELGHVCYNGCR